MTNRVFVAGVGMTRFTTPNQGELYTQIGPRAVREALADAGLSYDNIGQAFVGHVFGDSTSGQRVLYEIGMSGVPIVNVNNNCSSGATALYLARQAVAAGMTDCALALGFEQMQRGALGRQFANHPGPLDKFVEMTDRLVGYDPNGVMAAQLFGGAAVEYARKYDCKPETFARITVKARKHAAANERAVFRSAVSVEEVMASPAVCGPLTRLQCCPPTTGAAAALVVSEEFLKRHHRQPRVEVLGQAMTTDFASTFDERSMIKLVGYDMSNATAAAVYEQAGIGPADLDVVELHDCFTVNELLSYEALGLAPEGEAARLVADDDNTYGGQVVVNPSGGLLSKGHPLGATGLAQCAELVWQLRGDAGTRQVDHARLGLQHNLGLGGACVVTLYGSVIA
jgi:sterol carrier protein 2